MDQIDVKILKCLQADARENASLISEKVGMSVSAVIERIRKMEASGLIERHTTIINNQKAGKDVTALLQVALEHPRYNDDFRAVVQDNREVLECYFVTGEFDYLLKVVTGNTESLERLLNTIKSIPGVQRTLTSVVMSSVKFQPSVSPDELTLKERR
ncbi:MAG: Lrp/AsnC family transcriptional regulator [Clostridia bacterium]|nr:Lrp/AsnC family transcriptional regulator [Clostridia bacterium]